MTLVARTPDGARRLADRARELAAVLLAAHGVVVEVAVAGCEVRLSGLPEGVEAVVYGLREVASMATRVGEA